MAQPISEGELIELEQRVVWPLMRRCEDTDEYGSDDRVLATLHMLIDQARVTNAKGITESVNSKGQGIAND